jgi:hypothetical protein
MGLFELFGMGAARADVPNARAPQLARPEAFFQGQALALLQAALTGDATQARQLVAQGVDPNSHGPAATSKNVPQLTLLNYATGVQNERAMAILLSVGADPLLKPREGDGDAFLFAVVRNDAKMLDVLYRLFPLSRVPAQRQAEDAFAALGFNANTCLQVMFNHGLPPGVRDSRGDDLFMEALDREDFDTAEWLLVSIGVPLDGPPDRGGNTPANQVQRALGEVFRPGSPSYLRYAKFKSIMERKGIVFPVESSAEYRARMKGRVPPAASATSR